MRIKSGVVGGGEGVQCAAMASEYFDRCLWGVVGFDEDFHSTSVRLPNGMNHLSA